MLQADNSEHFALGQCAVARFCWESQTGPDPRRGPSGVDTWVMLEKGDTTMSSWRREMRNSMCEVNPQLQELHVCTDPVAGPTMASQW